MPKEESFSTTDQFRTISLLTVEGKIFSVLAKRMTSYMTENGYIYTTMQKGGISGFSGCLEHTRVLSQMIREAKVSKGCLTVVWLDLVNSSGSIPQTLIHRAQVHYIIIPQHIKGIIITLAESSYNSKRTILQHNGKPTVPPTVEKGIVTDCTISPIPFTSIIKLLITTAGREAQASKIESGI